MRCLFSETRTSFSCGVIGSVGSTLEASRLERIE